MPYIDRETRDQWDPPDPADTVGELTFCLTCTCIAYADKHAHAQGAINSRFRVYAEILGALEATKLEFYRREIAPYEDEKKKENGDVY